VSGGDPSGTWLVGRSMRDFQPEALLMWRDGKLVVDVALPPGSLRLSDVNSSGVAVGRTEPTTSPYVYEDGAIRKLAGGAGEAVAINDAGTIAGLSGPPSSRRPVVWASSKADPTPLPLPEGVPPAGDMQWVTDLAEDGSIIGTIGGEGYLWPPGGGAPRSLGAPPPVADEKSDPFRPMAFGFGWIYGYSSVAVKGDDGGPVASRPYTVRYEPRSRTWQELDALSAVTQLAGAGDMAGAVPEVFVGPVAITLPAPVAKKKFTEAYVLEHIDADAGAVAGTRIPAAGGLSVPFLPIIWRCR
jgi:hypothetical protein